MRADSLARHRKDLEAGNFKQPWERGLREKWIRDGAEHDRALLAWRAMRRGPAACLKCRSADVDLPDSTWADLPHGGCGGTLTCAATIVGGTFVRVRPHQYSPEGDLLAVGARPVRVVGDYLEEPLELWWENRSS